MKPRSTRMALMTVVYSVIAVICAVVFTLLTLLPATGIVMELCGMRPGDAPRSLLPLLGFFIAGATVVFVGVHSLYLLFSGWSSPAFHPRGARGADRRSHRFCRRRRCTSWLWGRIQR